MRFKNLLLVLVVASLAVFTAGCNDPDKLAQNGEYQKAYDAYMKNAQGLEGSLGGQYDTGNLGTAKTDAQKLVESYYKAGEMKDKLGDATAAQALYQKATKANYTTTERYAVVSEVWVDAGNQQVWVPGGYQEVWIDGTYEEVYVDGYYDAAGVYHDGYYKKVFKDGHYEQKYVDGHYENKWVAGHYEQKTTYKTRPYAFAITSAYIDQARAKTGAPVTAPVTPTTTRTDPPATGTGTFDAAAVKAAKDRLDAAYQRWVQSGQKTSGSEYQGYLEAKTAYDKLVQ